MLSLERRALERAHAADPRDPQLYRQLDLLWRREGRILRGKTLSGWLRAFSGERSAHGSRAQFALEAIGAPAVASLVRWLAAPKTRRTELASVALRRLRPLSEPLLVELYARADLELRFRILWTLGWQEPIPDELAILMDAELARGAPSGPSQVILGGASTRSDPLLRRLFRRLAAGAPLAPGIASTLLRGAIADSRERPEEVRLRFAGLILARPALIPALLGAASELNTELRRGLPAPLGTLPALWQSWLTRRGPLGAAVNLLRQLPEAELQTLKPRFQAWLRG